MALKITLNNKEIENPVIKFILGFIVSIVALGLLLIVFFLLLPFIWFILTIILMAGVAAALMILKLFQYNTLRRNQYTLTTREKQIAKKNSKFCP